MKENLGLIGIGIIIILILWSGMGRESILRGIESTNTNWYRTATNTQIACSGATSTQLLAAASNAGGRYSFIANTASTTPITICRSASGCLQHQGILLNPTASSSATIYEQNDAYYGVYSCIGNNGTSTVGISYAQN